MGRPFIARLRKRGFRSRPAAALRHLAVVAVTIITSLTLIASPAFAGTLTTMSLAVSTLQVSTTSKYDWGFKTATTANLTRVAATVPAGTSAAGRYLGLAADNSNTNNAEALDSVANSVTGALDLRANIAATDWTPTWSQVLMMKWNGSPNYSFIFTLDTSGVISLGRSADGSSTTFASSTASTGFTDGTSHWVRATYLPNDGAGNRVSTFYTSTDGVTWTILGTAVSQSGTGNIYDSNSPVDVGGSGGQAFAGKIYYAEMRNGIDDRVVLSMDPGDVTASSPSTWTSKRTQETWTLTRSGSDLKADIASDLTINAVTGIPSTGTAVLRMTDSLVLYSFASTSVASNTTSTLKVFGVINTSTAGSFTSTITTYNNAATPVSVDSGSPAAVIFTQGSVATPNFVQKITNTSSTGTTITGLLASNTAVGDMLVAAITWNSSVGATWTCSDNRNNVYTNGPSATVAASTQTTAICYAPVSTAGSTTLTVTFAGSTNKKGVVFSEYSGVANVNPVDVTASNNATGTTTANAITSTAATTTVNNDLIFGAVGNATAAANTATAGTSFTLRGDVTVTTAHDFVNEDRVLATAGSQAATFTYSTNSQAYGAVMIAFKPALIATPTFVQKKQNGASANTTTIAATFTGSTTVGNVIVVGVSYDYSSSPTFTCADNSSNTYVTVALATRSGDQASGICYAVVTTAGSSTVTMTTSVSAAFKAIQIQEYSGINVNSPFDVGTGTFSTTGTNAANNISSGSATSTWSNELIFGAFENSSNAAASVTAGTTSAAFTLRGQGGTSGSGAGTEFTTEDGITGVAGSVAATETYGHTGETYEAAMATFRPALLGTPATAVYGQAGVYTTASTATTSTGLSGAGNSATDPITHRLFVTDFANNRVLVFNCDTRNVPLDATADFVIGQSSFTANGAAVTQAGLFGPNGIVYDGANNRLFVVDQSANRVMVYDAGNISNGMNASYVIGQSSYTANATTTDNATLSTPQDLYFDGVNNRLYVGDKVHNRVLVFNTGSISSGMAATYVLGQAGFGTNGAATTSTGLSAPIGIGFDRLSGYLWVGDSANNRVVGYNTASLATGMAATYVLGQSLLTTNTGGTSQSKLSQPAAVAVAPGVLFVSDINNQRVLRFDTSSVSNGMNASGVYGPGNYASYITSTTQNTFSSPWGLRYDNSQGQLWVGDFGNNRVLQFNVDSSPPAPSSLAQYQSDGSTSIAVGGLSSSATAVFKASTSDVDASDTERLCIEIQPVSVAFTGYETTCGSAVNQGSTASATVATLSGGTNYHWQARLLDSAGTYSNWAPYGSNSDVVTAATDIYYSTGIPADYVYGQGGSYTTSNAAASTTGMSGSVDVAIDNVHHRMFETDYSSNRVLVFNLDSANKPTDATADYVLGQAVFTTFATGLTQSTMNGPNVVAYDPINDRLFVADSNNNRVLVFNTATITNGMNAAYVLGQTTFGTNTTAFTQSTLDDPTSVEFDSTNNRLFVSDYNNNRVMIYNTSSITNGMNAANVLGQSTFTANSSNVTQGGMFKPAGMSYDSMSKYLYVTQTNANRVTVYDLNSLSNGMNASFVLGQSSYTASGTAATATGLNFPCDVDASGSTIYVADATNNRVLGYSKASLATGMSATSVYGQVGYTNNTGTTTRTGLYMPEGVTFDTSSGDLFVTDHTNNRVLVYYADGAPTAPASLAQFKSNGTTGIPGTNLYTFDSSTQSWTSPGTLSSSSTFERTGAASLRMSVGAGTTTATAQEPASTRDLSANGPVFSLWVYVPSSITGSVEGNIYVDHGGVPATTNGPTVIFTKNAWNLLTVTDTPAGLASVSSIGVWVDTLPSAGTKLIYVDDVQQGGGIWTNETSVVMKGATSDSDVTDTNGLCVEAEPVGTAFTNVATACGTSVTQGGTASVTVTGLTTNTQYHWQARTMDSAGVYSAWTSYGGDSDTVTASTDFGVDTTAPTTAAIYDGSSAGVDAGYNNGLLTTLSGNWTAFADTSGSGIAKYTYSITTAPNSGTTILAATATGSTSFTASALSLRTSQIYYINVYATDVEGNNSSTVSSNGQLVAPTLTFSLNSTSLNIGHLNASNSYSNTQTLTTTTSTNAYNGYVVRQYSSGLLTSGSNSVASYAGTYATPTTWSGYGLGYTTSDTSIQSSGDLFGSGTKYAGLTASAPGDIVADHTSTVTGTPITGEVFTLTYKLTTPATQAAGMYTNTIRLSAIASF